MSGWLVVIVWRSSTLIAWAHTNPSVCQVGLAELDFGRAYQMAQFLVSIQLEADAKSFCKAQFQETLSSELKRKQTKAL